MIIKKLIHIVKKRKLNQDSYKICKKKIENLGIKLNSKISKDIKKTLLMLKIK